MKTKWATVSAVKVRVRVKVSVRSLGLHPGIGLRRCQTIDKVGQLLWAWFSRPRKSADKIVEP